jgi:large repetitive protein
MKSKIHSTKTPKIVATLIALFFLNLSISAQVLLDAHSNGLGASTWYLTTTQPNELILISSGGYATGGNSLFTTPGTVTVNGNDATYITEGEYNSGDTWTTTIWAYVAPTAGTYTLNCTENILNSPFYFNYAASVYEPSTTLSLSNILIGGNADNAGQTTISAAITTTVNNSFVYGYVLFNDNGGSGTINWNGNLNNLDYNYISDGVDGSQAGSTISAAGSYTITVTDIGASNPWAALALIAVQPSSNTCTLAATATTTANVTCNGGNNGSASSTPTGGTSPFTYLWSDGNSQTTANANNLSAGTYTVTIQDSAGCSATASATITQPNVLNDTVTILANVSCNGGNNGSAMATSSGGTSPYTYLWSDASSQTTATATGLSMGTYTVTVTDSNGCSATASTNITQPNVLIVSDTAIANVSCNGGNNGADSAFASGGTMPYTYLWSDANSQTTAVATGLSSGTYTVTVADNNGCSATALAAISQPVTLSATATVLVNNTCDGGNHGVDSAAAIGGTTPYTYLWSDGSSQTTAIATGLSSGSYTVTVTDANGCSATASSIITATSSTIRDSVVSILYPICNAGGGSVKIGVTGGFSPYYYFWTPVVSYNDTATGLLAGTYSITIEDSRGCTSLLTFTITQPVPVADSVVPALTSTVTCYGASDGYITVAPSNGVSPYTYNWAPNVSSTATATGLSAGLYSVSVTDNNGCTSTRTVVTITQPPYPLTDSVSVLMNLGCYGGNGGVASIGTRGGAKPYTYLWSPSGGTSYSDSGLYAGTYTVTITDNYGCSNTITLTMTQPTLLVDTLTSLTNPMCNRDSSGSISIGTIGGSTPYTYTWSPNVSSTTTASGLSAGSYTVHIEDSHTCAGTLSFTITQPIALRDSLVTSGCSSILCKGDNDGMVTVGVKNGVAPYTYTWTPNVSSTSSATGLSAGVYSVTIMDNNGCSGPTTAIYLVTQPALAIKDSVSVLTNVGCHGGNGGIASIGTIGGTTPYTYSWAPNTNTTYTASGLTAGTYTVTITDNHGCGNTVSFTITQPAEPLKDSVTSITYPMCYGDSGSATIGANGGTSPYGYVWHPDVSSSTSASGLLAGTYTVEVNDAHGCMAQCIFTVTQPPAMIFTHDSVPQNGSGCNGLAAVTVISGGVPPFTYKWSAGQTTDTIKNQCTGEWCCVVTDHNGCSQTTCVTIKDATGIDAINNSSSLNIYPDPNNGFFTIDGLTEGQVIEVYNYLGQSISNTVANNETMHFDISTHSNGIYLVRILTREGILVTQKKIVKAN